MIFQPTSNLSIPFLQPSFRRPHDTGVAATPTFVSKAQGPAAGSGTSYVMNAPSGVGENDIVMVVLVLNQPRTITPATGFTLKASTVYEGGDNFSTYVFWKREDSTPDSTYTFSWTGATFRWGASVCFDGADTAGDPWDTHVSAGHRATDTNALNGCGITTTSVNALGVMVCGMYEDATSSTPPSGWTERIDAGETSGGVNNPLMVATLDMPTPGTYRIEEGSYATNAGPTSTIALALRANPAGTATPASTGPVLFDFDMSTSAGTTLTEALMYEAQSGDVRCVSYLNSGASYTGMTIENTVFSSAHRPPNVTSGGRAWTPGSKMWQHNHATTVDDSRLVVNWPGSRFDYSIYTEGTIYILAQFNASSSSADVNIDHAIIQFLGGGYAVLQQTFNGSGNYAIRAHGTSGVGSSINITSGRLYWCGLKADNTNNQCVVSVYDAENSNALVGTSTVSSTMSGAMSNCLIGSGYIQAAATGTTRIGAILMVPSLTGWPLIAP